MGGEPVSVLDTLVARIYADRPALERLDDYYAGRQPLAFLHPEVEARAGDRLFSLAVNWPRVIVGSIEERLDVDGFRMGGEPAGDDRLWDFWQANDLDEWSQMVHVDALTHGRAAVTVWAGGDGGPRITPESARQMAVMHRPGTRDVAAAVKVWLEAEDGGEPAQGAKLVERAVLYLPDRIEHHERQAAGAGVALVGGKGWQLRETVRNPLGVVPVVPFTNRPRLADLCGESELSDVLPLADAVNKLATDMLVSSEYHAMPRRWVTGMEIPREGSAQQRLSEEVKQKWAEAFPGKPWIGGPGASFGQFPEAQLDNFIAAIRMLTGHIAAIAGLPPHYLGLSSDNPASADAIRSSEAALIRRAQRKMRGFGGSWERVMRLALRVADSSLPAGAESMETIWRDPATPTPAQKADAAVKLTSGDRPVISVRQAREDLGYSPGQIARMEADDARAAMSAATADLQARLDMAAQLQAQQGMDQPTAFAAVGLMAAASVMQGGLVSSGGSSSAAGPSSGASGLPAPA